MLINRIVFVHYDSPVDVSGVSSWLMGLLPYLQQAGFDVRVHIFNFGTQPGPNTLYIQSLGIPFKSTSWPQKIRAGVRQCIEWMNEDQPDVYIPNCIYPAYLAAAHATAFGVKTVGVLHSDDAFYSAILNDFISCAPAPRLSALVAVSSYLEAKARGLMDSNLRLERIPCGVSIPDQITESENGVFRLVYVGRLIEEQKQISKVTRALCEAAHRNPRVEALIVGDGEAKADVEAILGQMNFNTTVQLLGRLDTPSVYKVLLSSHVIVLLSDYEGLPVSLLEAMACGVVPVCLNMRSGINELINSGVNGFIVSDRDEGFQSVIQELEANPSLWRQCSIAARKTVETDYSDARCHQDWANLLNALTLNASEPRFPITSMPPLGLVNPSYNWNEVTLAQRAEHFVKRFLGKVASKIEVFWH
jgi:glycosyltransferase involved in cell wall biosynthesis